MAESIGLSPNIRETVGGSTVRRSETVRTYALIGFSSVRACFVS